MLKRFELRLEVPRWQQVLSWGLCVLYVVAATVALRQDWLRGARGWALWLPYGFRFAQGLLLQWVCLGINATVLVVAQGQLTVTTNLRKVLRLPGVTLPIQNAALEWIDTSLTLQNASDGFLIRLGYAPAARRAADWLVTHGARPPVGG